MHSESHPAPPEVASEPPAAPTLGDVTPLQVPPGHHGGTRVGDILVANELVDRADLERVVGSAGAHRLGDALIAAGLIDERDVYRALAAQRGLPFATLDALAPVLDTTLAASLPRAFLERHQVIPVARAGDDLVVAGSDPLAQADDLAKALRARRGRLYLVTPTDYRRLWMLTDARTGAPARDDVPAAEAAADLLALEGHGGQARLVGLFDTLLLEAIAERASDLHLERYGDEVRIRLRVDGDLRDLSRVKLSPAELVGLVNVVKINAGMDIAERRVPQGGRIRRHAGGKAFDLRVQTQPALHGEHVVIRLLPQETRPLVIEELGFAPEVAAPYRRLLDSPGGLVLVVGPTGSGKSTTLYAGLQHIARDTTRKVITVEDPIEYAVRGVQQTQVRPELGFGFAHAMRAFVREDPDVILVGEVRDGETALEAVRASQTGHLVLSTLHCNDAVDAAQRLLDLGMHANSVASELVAVIAQRLARRVCDGCRVDAALEPEIARELFPDGRVPAGFRCSRGRGCALCDGHGTRGRIAVVEYLRSGPAVRRAVARAVPVDELREVALAEGLVSMRSSALRLVCAGVIPAAELPWVLPPERMGAL